MLMRYPRSLRRSRSSSFLCFSMYMLQRVKTSSETANMAVDAMSRKSDVPKHAIIMNVII